MRYRAQVPTHSFAFVGADKATAGTGRHRGHRRRRRRAAGAVQPGGEHRRDPGRARDPRRTALDDGAGHRLLPHHRRKAVARHGRRMPVGDRGGQHLARRSAATTARASGIGILDGWLVHEGDHADIDGVEVRSVPLLMTDPAATAEMVRAGLDLAGVRSDRARCTEHGTGAPRVEILPVPGLPEFRPGDDLAAALAAAAPWLRDGDVVVVTSKVVSKCEGRIVAAPDGSRGAGCAAAQADRRRGGAGAGPQGPDADHRERARPGAGRRRRGRLQRRLGRIGAAARRPRRQRRGAAGRAARTARRHRRRGHHRHHGPGLAQRPDRRRHRRGRV